MGVASGYGEQEVGVASGSGWNLWVWLLGVVMFYIIILYLFWALASECKISLEFFPLVLAYPQTDSEVRLQWPTRSAADRYASETL